MSGSISTACRWRTSGRRPPTGSTARWGRSWRSIRNCPAASTSSSSDSRSAKIHSFVVVSAVSAWDRRSWLILGVIGLAQLMVVLDVTVMNIEVPSAQRALHFTTVDRQWVVTAYTLAFGSLLLPAGRLADLLGRKVTLLVGLAGFAVVSAIGGASVNFAMLVTARACQGAFAALLVPAALSLLTTTFTEPKDRSKAFGIYG